MNFSAASRLAELLEQPERHHAPEARLEPDDRELMDLVATSQRVRQLQSVPPAPDGLRRGRQMLLAEARQRATGRSHSRDWRAMLANLVAMPVPRAAVAGAALVAVLAMGGGWTARASAQALPGDALYAVKRLGEELRLRAADPAERSLLETQLQARRREEALAVLALRREAGVSFEDTLLGRHGGVWQVGQFKVRVGEEQPDLPVGSLLRVIGRTRSDGTVMARQVVLLQAPAAQAAARTDEVDMAEAAPRQVETDLINPEQRRTTSSARTPGAEGSTQEAATPTIASQPDSRPAAGQQTAPRRVRWEGRITTKRVSVWTIGGRDVLVDDAFLAQTDAGATVGARVMVEAVVLQDGRLKLVSLVVLESAGEPVAEEWRGPIQSIDPAVWVVSGVAVRISSGTRIEGLPAVGKTAQVRALRYPDDSLEATHITVEEPNVTRYQWTGTIKALAADRWQVEWGERTITLLIGEHTLLEGLPAVGAIVDVEAESIPGQNDDEVLLARVLSVRSSSPPSQDSSTGPAPEPDQLGTPARPAAVASQGGWYERP
jgi:hypothetical protein